MTLIAEVIDVASESPITLNAEGLLQQPGVTPIEDPAILEGREIAEEIIQANRPKSLGEYREAIDELDFMLLAIMAARTTVTAELSKFKAEQGLPAMDLSREAEIHAKATEFARQANIDPQAVGSLMLALIGTAREQHRDARRASTTTR